MKYPDIERIEKQITEKLKEFNKIKKEYDLYYKQYNQDLNSIESPLVYHLKTIVTKGIGDLDTLRKMYSELKNLAKDKLNSNEEDDQLKSVADKAHVGEINAVKALSVWKNMPNLVLNVDNPIFSDLESPLEP